MGGRVGKPGRFQGDKTASDRHFFQRGVTTLPVVLEVGFAPFQNMLPVVCTGIQDDDAFQ